MAQPQSARLPEGADRPANSSPSAPDFPYVLRWDRRRQGQFCRIVKDTYTSVLLEFEDGFQMVMSRNAVIRRKDIPDSARQGERNRAAQSGASSVRQGGCGESPEQGKGAGNAAHLAKVQRPNPSVSTRRAMPGQAVKIKKSERNQTT